KSAMALAVSHSGDSDSVGAIVGNVLGARYGTAALPQEWLDVLAQRVDIEKMADDLSKVISPAVQHPSVQKKPNIGI
ncbi:MAG: ADP-ribosylglycohydrolase family protein, partial [Alphaproteobacteria bacterium]